MDSSDIQTACSEPVHKKKKTFEKSSEKWVLSDISESLMRKILEDDDLEDEQFESEDEDKKEEEGDNPYATETCLEDSSEQENLSPNSASFSPPLPKIGTNPPASSLTSFVWNDNPPSALPNFAFQANAGLKIIPSENSSICYFSLLFTDSLLAMIVEETNNFATEVFLRGHSLRSRITDWKELTIEEFKVFLGLHFHMGIIKISRLKDYWNTSEYYNLKCFPSRMSRDRFMSILQCLHFSRNPSSEEPTPDDSLYKIRPLVNFFHERMIEVLEPGREISLDESLAPWRGRVHFRSYIPNKAHKYGIKLYMLAENDGLIHRFLIYAGASDAEVGGQGHAKKVVHKLMNGLKYSGRSLYMDNFYNSVSLTSELLNEQTFVTGTLRPLRKDNPTYVVNKKLAKGEMVQQWTKEGINVMKWKDRRDVLTISSEFSGKLTNVVNKRGIELQKPEVVCKYNKNMGGIDRADQLLSYYISTRKSLKWYKKLGFHIFEIMLLNSYLLFKRYSGEKGLDILKYREIVIHSLCGTQLQKPEAGPSSPPIASTFINSNHFPKSSPSEPGQRRN